MPLIDAIDLFAGAGGFSEGAKLAGLRLLWAANHWREAVKWHKVNHPAAAHACQDLHQANFHEAPRHDVLLAAPACQGHTPARGKDRPHHDAQRATAWAVVTCAEVHRPPVCVIENVPAFSKWELYPAWCGAMVALGYALSPHVIDAADHGVPQHRKRLFIVATRSRHPLVLDLPRAEHVPVSRVIDFERGKWSRIDRRGRAPSTLARVANGRRAFGDRFVMPYYGSGSGLTGRSLGRPLGTVVTKARWAVVDGERMRMVLTSEGREVMGFGSDYQLPDDEALGWHLLGNAVVPLVARDVLQAIGRAA